MGGAYLTASTPNRDEINFHLLFTLYKKIYPPLFKKKHKGRFILWHFYCKPNIFWCFFTFQNIIRTQGISIRWTNLIWQKMGKTTFSPLFFTLARTIDLKIGKLKIVTNKAQVNYYLHFVFFFIFVYFSLHICIRTEVQPAFLIFFHFKINMAD